MARTKKQEEEKRKLAREHRIKAKAMRIEKGLPPCNRMSVPKTKGLSGVWLWYEKRHGLASPAEKKTSVKSSKQCSVSEENESDSVPAVAVVTPVRKVRKVRQEKKQST